MDWSNLTRACNFCFYEKSSLKCTLIYTANIKSRQYFQDKKNSSGLKVADCTSNSNFRCPVNNVHVSETDGKTIFKVDDIKTM